jgi:hypothetical protein
MTAPALRPHLPGHCIGCLAPLPRRPGETLRLRCPRCLAAYLKSRKRKARA